MTNNERVQTAVDNFLDFLDTVPRVGVGGRDAELKQLRVLVGQYPDEARRILKERDKD